VSDTQADKRHEPVPLDHEYDGIAEYDNPLPRWWVWIFWGTFLFAIGYFFHYHLSGKGRSRLTDLEEDVRVANEIAMKAASKEQVSEESLTKLLENGASQAAGAAIFAARCQSCHAEQGKGLIGPNLTDAYWLHGHGKLMDIFDTVSNGVLAKGMPAWNKQLTPMELRNVVAFVGSLRGKNLPGKEPQGEPIGAADSGPPATAANQGSAPVPSVSPPGANPSVVAPTAAAAASPPARAEARSPKSPGPTAAPSGNAPAAVPNP
jgi:cytochrome c oxidase cbb3-type subunit 3